MVFLDPPYDAADEYAIALGPAGRRSVGLLAEEAVVIAEHRRKERLNDEYGALAAHAAAAARGCCAEFLYGYRRDRQQSKMGRVCGTGRMTELKTVWRWLAAGVFIYAGRCLVAQDPDAAG